VVSRARTLVAAVWLARGGSGGLPRGL